MGLRLSIFILIITLTSCGDNSTGVKSESEFTGEDLFMQRCASCHGVDGSLQASTSPDLKKSVLSNQEILDKIDNGGNGMPAFKTIISSSKEKKKIVDHVLTLRK